MTFCSGVFKNAEGGRL